VPSLDDIASGIHAFFKAKVPGTGGDSPGDMLLVFDALGVPLHPNEFGASATPGQQEVFASQRAAQLADQLPAANVLTGGVFLPRTGSRLSRWYEMALSSSEATATADPALSAFERRKSDALTSFEQNRLLDVAMPGSGIDPGGVHDHHQATSMSPRGWFRPDAEVWSAFTQSEASPAPAPGPGAVPLDPLPIPPFVIRVPPDEPDPLVQQWLSNARDFAVLPTRPDPVIPVDPGIGVDPGIDIGVRERAIDVSPVRDRLFDRAPLGDQDPLLVRTTLREPFSAELVDQPAILAATNEIPVQTAGFSVSFEYSIVTFDRPWWDDVFLSARGWRVPDFAAGELATGKASLTSGQFITLVTAGMVVIRRLAISASWETSDRAAAQAAMSLGPFCIAGAEFVNETLTRPGLQVIAWICQVPPLLPPN
jgi:2-oxoglutarate dehydrogenase E2 component (dihydrolipoamide succinyltransferase)